MRGKADQKVFKFNFRTVNDRDSPHIAWVEANGIKRLCQGPGLSPGGTDDPNCISELRPGVDT